MHQNLSDLPHCVVSPVAYQPCCVTLGYRTLEETASLGSKSNILVVLTISLEIPLSCQNKMISFIPQFYSFFKNEGRKPDHSSPSSV